MFAFIPLAACAFHFSLFLCTSSFQVLLKVLKSTAFTEKFRDVAPSEPVLLTLERLPSDGMLFRLHKHTQTHTHRVSVYLAYSTCLSLEYSVISCQADEGYQESLLM